MKFTTIYREIKNILLIFLITLGSFGIISCYNYDDINTTNTSNSDETESCSTLTAPDNLSASGANNTVTISWNSVSDATSYTLYWDNVSGIDNNDTAITSITNDNYTHSSLDNGSTYYYKVASVNSCGAGDLSSTASAVLSSAIQGSETNEGHTYALTTSTMNWQAAADAAAAVGGYLTVLNTKAENVWLYEKFGSYGGTNRDLWIGSKDNVTEGTWYWYTGTTSGDGGITDNISSGATWPDGSSKWRSGEPNDHGSGEDCNTIRGSLSSWTWNDYSCSANYYGIIEIDN